jgi:hypothetical protein
MPHDCQTGPPGYIGWRAGTTTLFQSRLFPQSGTKNLVTGLEEAITEHMYHVHCTGVGKAGTLGR